MYVGIEGSALADRLGTMSGYNAEYTAQENEPSDALVVQRLWAELKETRLQLRTLIVAFNKYVEIDDELAKGTGNAPVHFTEELEEPIRDVRDLRIDGLTIPEHLKLKKFMVTYHVNLIHEVEVEAGDDIEARMVFEDMYENKQNELPEYHDIDHEIVEVTYIAK